MILNEFGRPIKAQESCPSYITRMALKELAKCLDFGAVSSGVFFGANQKVSDLRASCGLLPEYTDKVTIRKPSNYIVAREE